MNTPWYINTFQLRDMYKKPIAALPAYLPYEITYDTREANAPYLDPSHTGRYLRLVSK